MIRIFRKYQRPIILVGLPTLLVIFLIPQAIQSLGNLSARRGRTLATFVNTAGEPVDVSAGEFETAQRQLHMLSDRGALNASLLDAIGMGFITEPEHWYLLAYEAQQHGLIGGEADALGMIQGLTGQTDVATQKQIIANIAGRTSATNPYMDGVQALATARGVARYLQLYAGDALVPMGGFSIPRASDKRLEELAWKYLNSIDANVVTIAGSDNRENQTYPEFIDTQLEVQLQKYADVEPGEGEMGFGYRLPNRVRIEWLAVDAQAVGNALEESERLSTFELRKYWLRSKQEDPTRFAVPGVEAGAETFDQVKARVKAEVRREVTAECMAEIARFVDSELLRVVRDLPRDGAYYELPEDWEAKRLKYDELAIAIQQYVQNSSRFGVKIPLPTYQRNPEWQSAEELAFLPGVGRATTDRYGTPAKKIGDLVSVMKEFGGSDQVFFQMGVSERLNALNGSVYLVRVTDIDPARPAANVDEVRDQILSDLKRKFDYQDLATKIDDIRRRTTAEGLQAVAEQFDAGFPRPFRNITHAPEDSLLARLGRPNTVLPAPVGADGETIDRIVDRGRELILRLIAEGNDVDDLSIADRTMVIDVPQKLSIVTLQFTNLRPVVREDMGLYAFVLGGLLAEEERGDQTERFAGLQHDEMISRYQFHFTSEDDESEDAGTAPATSEDEDTAAASRNG